MHCGEITMQLFSNLSLPDIELPFLYQPFMDICTYNGTYITIRGTELSLIDF